MDAALWDNEEIRNFYIYKGFNSSGSSLFEQNLDFVRSNFNTLSLKGPKWLAETWFDRSELLKIEEISCKTLDQILMQENSNDAYHFLKIDAQGAEFQILKGSEQFLKNSCIGIYLELFTIPLYKGIVLLPEVEAYLKELDFILIKKMPPHGSFDSQHDCLFLKNGVDSPESRVIRAIYKI
ncbi:MAG: FkbM family methyltransferase [Microscillaceae bacterium]|nr:FkbM family methyltransferase [Microscillaceae bacterium]